MNYLWAFVIGGAICVVGQLLIDRTNLTPARILVCYVTAGVVLGGLGVYQYLIDWAGAGATVPLTGFGFSLANGVRKAVAEQGLLGALTGGITATAGGIAAAIFFGFVVSLVVGMPAQEAIHRLKGIRCGFKPTSCPDQFACGLEKALSKQS